MSQQRSSDFDKLDIDRPRSTSSIAFLSSSSFDRKYVNYESMELQAQVRRLELERDNLINLLRLSKMHHREELLIMKQISKTKLDLLKESAHYKERLLRDEIDDLEARNYERIIEINQRAQADIDSMKQTITLERQSLHEKLNQLSIDKSQLEETRQELEIVRHDLIRGEVFLAEREQYLDERENDLNKRDKVANKIIKLLHESGTQHHRIHDEQIELFSELEAEYHKLHTAEKQLFLEKRRLAQQTENLVTYKLEADDNGLRQSTCLHCRIPIRECSSLYDLHRELENDDDNTVNEQTRNQINNTNGNRKAINNDAWTDLPQLRTSRNRGSYHLARHEETKRNSFLNNLKQYLHILRLRYRKHHKTGIVHS
ncbi:unnamed protein product [Schistosoma turkestanicum]|nr:unnamed protein product [Schistosoma turkestanicum]